MATGEQIVPLDATDRKILDVLQRDGRITNAALAEELHLSPSPCLRRVRRLEESGLIAGYRAELDRSRLGLDLTIFAELRVSEHSPDTAQAIGETLAEAPEVISAHVVSGSADFLIEIAVPDLAAYERFLFDHLLKLDFVNDVRSNFALRRIKAPGPLPTG